MQKHSYKYVKFIALAAALPFVYGCAGGVGTGSLLGFLFGGGLSGGTEIALLAAGAGGGIAGALGLGGAAGGGAGAAGIATLVQPEPASMLLVGSGLMALGYFKSKINQRSK